MRRPRSIGDILEGLGIALAATLLIGLLFGYRLVVLTTSSMAPTAPAGSLLIVSTSPPEDIDLDDLIVMRRSPSTLVTHRVVGLETVAAPEGPADSPQIQATTKGDANRTPDPTAYQLEDEQRVVRFVVPFVGWLILPILTSPLLVIGGAAAIVFIVASAVALDRRLPVDPGPGFGSD